MKYYLGIDPGLSGALAFYDPKQNVLEVFDMPTHTVKVNTKKKRVIDLHALTNIVDARANDTRMAMVEEVGAMPEQGVTSMFSFGFSAGCVQMAVVANRIPITLVRPAVWKRAIKITADKDAARRQASRLLPAHAHHWPLVKHDGRAEAALLALYFSQSQSIVEHRVDDLI